MINSQEKLGLHLWSKILTYEMSAFKNNLINAYSKYLFQAIKVKIQVLSRAFNYTD